MNNVQIRAQLLEIRRQVDTLLVEVERTEAAPEETPRIMRPAAYAKHRGVSLRLVYRWIQLGMPAERRGKVVRVVVREADAWDERASIARSAELEASGGGKTS